MIGMKRFPLFLAFAAVAVSLTGCDVLQRPPQPDPDAVVVSAEGGQLLVHFCNATELDRFQIEQRNLRNGAPWQVIWEFNQHVELPAGSILFSDDDSGPLGAATTAPTFMSGDQLAVYGGRDAPEGGYAVFDATFFLPDSGIAPGAWLHYDGRVTVDPCD